MSPIWHAPHFDYDPIYRQMSTEELLPALECLSWDRLEATDLGESTAFTDLQIADLQKEIERRERLRALPDALPWPPAPTQELRAYWREIKDRVTLVDLWDQHFPSQPLRKSGRSWRGPCPLHGGDNPLSFSVYNGGRNWHCFVCGASGDLFAFAGLLWRTTRFGEIADHLAAEFGIEKTRVKVSRRPDPIGCRDSGQLLKPRKRQSFEPFERRNGELVRS